MLDNLIAQEQIERLLRFVLHEVRHYMFDTFAIFIGLSIICFKVWGNTCPIADPCFRESNKGKER